MNPELRKRPWFIEVDCSKYVAYIVASINHGVSVSTIMDPHDRIVRLLENYTGEKA